MGWLRRVAPVGAVAALVFALLWVWAGRWGGQSVVRTWHAELDGALQPVAAALAEAVDQIPVYLPAELPAGTPGWDLAYEAAADRYRVAMTERPAGVRIRPGPMTDRTPLAHVAGALRGALLLDYPVPGNPLRQVDLGRGVTGYLHVCARAQGGRCPVTALAWRSGGWSFVVWSAGSGSEAARQAAAAAQHLVSALPGHGNPVRPGSAGQMVVRLREGREETGILWFHDDADLLVFHTRSAQAAVHLSQLLEQVD